MLKLIIFVLSWLALVPAGQAEELKRFGSTLPALGGIKSNEKDFLPADQAFRMVALQDGRTLSVQFVVTPGHYLYKDRFRFQAGNGNVILGEPAFNHPPRLKDDPEFGRVPVYHEDVVVTLPVSGRGEVRIGWQGCADAGLCYPPQSQVVAVDAAARTPDIRPSPKDVEIPIPTIVPTISYDVEEEPAVLAGPETAPPAVAPPSPPADAVRSPAPDGSASIPDSFGLRDRPGLALLTLWLLGLGLAFTPCVLPMLPIVAGLVAREHAANARQGFLLALAYGIGVATSYGTLGGLIALFGGQANLALWLQHPAVLGGFSLMFALLALASFDVFHLQLPAGLQHRLDALSRKGKAGSYAGTVIIGFFSALVVSPCVSAPLAGVLLTVSTLGQPVTGFAALFALGLGLSTPLLILGASEGRLMPKSGLWMNRVKQAFGLMLLGVAISLLNRLLPGPASLFLWGVLAAGAAFWINLWGGKWRVVWRALSYTGLIWAAALLAGAAAGGSNPLQPLSGFGAAAKAPVEGPAIVTIRDSMALDGILETSRTSGTPVLLDFYADWCVSCKTMEREVFDQPETRRRLAGWTLVRADITDNTEASRQLLQRFGLFGPPAVIFFRQGQEVAGSRILGEVGLNDFRTHLQRHGLE